jgi:hypothetical protein
VERDGERLWDEWSEHYGSRSRAILDEDMAQLVSKFLKTALACEIRYVSIDPEVADGRMLQWRVGLSWDGVVLYQ